MGKKVKYSDIICIGLGVIALSLFFNMSADDFTPHATASVIEGHKIRTSNSEKSKANAKSDIWGDLRVKIIDEKTVCVVGSFDAFLQERFNVERGPFFCKMADSNSKLPLWSVNIWRNVLGAKTILKYRPKIAQAFTDSKAFKITSGKVVGGGYWLSPAGQARFAGSETLPNVRTKNAFVRHFAFLQLAEPMLDDTEYEITTPLLQTVKFKYEKKKNPSVAIKLNQLGYSPSAHRKYAYIGEWLGTLGAYKASRFYGKPFQILNSSDSSVAFEGFIGSRMSDPYYKNEIPFTGEVVAEIDFSSFSKIGKYRIYVPTLGVSDEFSISNAAIGNSFYIHAKGLYNKRCGIEKARPFTNWTFGKCHASSWVSDFPPDVEHYGPKKGRDAGFFDASGKPLKISHFKLISSIGGIREIPVFGGWHDAADYDRRPYHYNIVNDLLSAYLFRPQNFSDSQLNIPESGNGIADIIDEAEWGVKVWKSAQNPDGSVGGWIEANSHPSIYNPADDTQKYYISAASLGSTMRYAAHASMLALALREAGAYGAAKNYEKSAIAAYKWAANPANRLVRTYLYDNKKIFYREEPAAPKEFTFKASFNLLLLTGDKKYAADCLKLENSIDRSFTETTWRLNPLLFSEFAKYSDTMPQFEKIRAKFEEKMLRYANERLKWLDNSYPYRIPWYPASHHYVSHMAWGKFHPLNIAKFFMTAHELTNAPKYRDAAYLCNDWHNGANPLGMSMTSGLGKTFPVRFLDLPSYGDSIEEYVGGITPYQNTFGIPRKDVELAHFLIYKSYKDRNFAPKPVSLLPEEVVGDGIENSADAAKKLGKKWPIWRRFANVEAFTVASSEYTVAETIGPAAAVTGWLLDRGYKPDSKVKNYVPVDDLRDLDGFFAMP